MRNSFQMCCLPFLYDLKQNVEAYAAEVTAETSLWRANQNNFSLIFMGVAKLLSESLDIYFLRHLMRNLFQMC